MRFTPLHIASIIGVLHQVVRYTDGKLLFINDTNIPVITRDNPTENVQVPVIAVGK